MKTNTDREAGKELTLILKKLDTTAEKVIDQLTRLDPLNFVKNLTYEEKFFAKS